MTKYIDRYYLNGELYGIKFGGGGWQPGANTLLYWDFENDNGNTITNKASTGSTYDGIYYSTPTYGTTTGGKKYFDCSGNNYGYSPVVPFNYGDATINLWTYIPSTQNQEWYILGTGRWSYARPDIMASGYNSDIEFNVDSGLGYTTTISQLNGWHLLTYCLNDTTPTIYIDGVSVATSSTTYSNTNTYNFAIGTIYEQKHQTNKIFEGGFGAVIIENTAWTSQEIADYFNQTKSLYGIS